MSTLKDKKRKSLIITKPIQAILEAIIVTYAVDSLTKKTASHLGL